MYEFKYILNEASWKKSYSAHQILLPFKGQDMWVHFNNNLMDQKYNKTHASKFGINPKKNHHDPVGIYFYPVDWILEDMEDGYRQYAVTNENMYVVKLKPTTKLIKLHEITQEEVLAIVTRNGWLEDYHRVVPKLPHLDIRTTCPGHTMYAVAQTITSSYNYLSVENYKPASWYQLLRGYDGIEDRVGIIMGDEPQQMMVFSKSSVEVVKTDRNKYTQHYEEDIKQALFDSTLAIDDVDFTWNNKIITGEFEINNIPHFLRYDPMLEDVQMSSAVFGVEVVYSRTYIRLKQNSNPLGETIENAMSKLDAIESGALTSHRLRLSNAEIATVLGVKNSRCSGTVKDGKAVVTCTYPSGVLNAGYTLEFYEGRDLTITMKVGVGDEEFVHTETCQLPVLSRKAFDEAVTGFGKEVLRLLNMGYTTTSGSVQSKIRQMIERKFNEYD